MPSRENLFQLIKLLSPDERKYFTKTLSKQDNSEPVLLNLFKDLVKARNYEPDKLNKKYKSLRVLLSKLKKELLEAMRVKRLDKDIDNKIFCHMKDYQFYYEKGFLKSATKSLEEAKKLAVAYEKTGTTLEIVKEEMRLRMEQGTSELKETLEGLVKENQELMGVLSSEVEAMNRYYTLFAKFRVDGKNDEPGELPFPDVDRNTSSFYSQHYKLNSNMIHCRLELDFSGTEEQLRKMVECWKSQDKVRLESIWSYKKLLGNFATILVYQGKFEEGLSIVEELEKLPLINFNDDAETFQAIAQVRLLWALNAGLDIPLEDFLKEMDKGLRKYTSKINPGRKLSIWYNMFILCLFKSDLKRARFWMDQILTHKKLKVKKEDLYATRLLRLLLEIDSGNLELLESALKSTYVLFHRADMLDDLCQTTFRFVKVILKYGLGHLQKHLADFNNELDQLEKEGNQDITSGFRAVVQWVEERRL